MIKKITSTTTHQTAEGMRATFTYSLISDGGDVTKSNVRATNIVMDEAVLAAIQVINDYLYTKIPEES